MVCVGGVGGELRLGNRDEPGRRVYAITGVSHIRGGWRCCAFGLGVEPVCLDDVSLSDAMRTKRASAGTAQRLLHLTVRVAVVTKSCLPPSSLFSPLTIINMESYVAVALSKKNGKPVYGLPPQMQMEMP